MEENDLTLEEAYKLLKSKCIKSASAVRVVGNQLKVVTKTNNANQKALKSVERKLEAARKLAEAMVRDEEPATDA